MRFHLRRLDREVKDGKVLRRLLASEKHFTLSMADSAEPYAVPMGYVYDEFEDCVYIHCAKEGRKIDVLARNPRVWGVVVHDEGIQEGACVNMYVSAMFTGSVKWVSDPGEKRKIMSLFAEKLSADTRSVKERLEKLFADGAPAPGVLFGKIKIEELTGKRSTEMTEERLGRTEWD